MGAHPPLEPPDSAYVRQRWIPRATVDWAKAADQILIRHGVVVGRQRYQTRDAARHHARRLKRLMVELRMHEAWQLREHTERVQGAPGRDRDAQGGWIWSLEYLGRGDHA